MPHQRTLRIELPSGGAITLTVHHAKMLQRAQDGEIVRGISLTSTDLRWAGMLRPTPLYADDFMCTPLGSLALTLYRHFAD